MNELEKIVLNYKYRVDIGRYKFIYNRTKRKRIKDKVLTKLFIAYTSENPLTIFEDVVLMKNGMYIELLATLESLRLEIEKIQQEVNSRDVSS